MKFFCMKRMIDALPSLLSSYNCKSEECASSLSTLIFDIDIRIVYSVTSFIKKCRCVNLWQQKSLTLVYKQWNEAEKLEQVNQRTEYLNGYSFDLDVYTIWNVVESAWYNKHATKDFKHDQWVNPNFNYYKKSVLFIVHISDGLIFIEKLTDGSKQCIK